MNGKASLAAFIGLALVLANLWKTQGSLGNLTTGNVNWKNLGIEIGGVVFATFIAQVSDDAANLVLVAFVILWLLFLMHLNTKSAAPAAATTTAKTSTPARKGVQVA